MNKEQEDAEFSEESSWYLNRIFKIAQDRRYFTAIDVWALILDAVFTKRTYKNIDGSKIIGITAADIATSLNMHLSSVYHNLKILQTSDLDLLESEDLIGYNEKGRKVTQKVFRIPEAYYTEYRRMYEKLQEAGFEPPHKEFTFFNLLKIRGILSHYTALLNKERVLVKDETQEISDWYKRWLKPIKLNQFNVTPGVIYQFTEKDMKKILTQIADLLESNKDNYTEENEASGELPLMFSYLVFVPYSEEMKENEWLNRDELLERQSELTPGEKEQVLPCEKDHETFFKYGLACPVCGKEPGS
ncbi:MAG: hypothetical protein ACTSSF_11405 [Candidatus Heimdallarchaeaceae archaeon]